MQCTSPILVKNPRTCNVMRVPCGHCLACRLQKSREWSARLLNELNYWDDACFQTLTYRDEDRPTLACGKSYLKKDDLQKFIKRLRKYFDDRKIKYYACGEYGDEGKNCHFHIIIFGISVKEMKEALPKLWKYGEPFLCTTGVVNADSCNYVTGYVRKKLNGTGKLLDSYFWCLPPPFMVCSHGFGLRYAEEYKENILEYGLTVKGQPVSIPRYYSKKIEDIKKVIDARSSRAIVKFCREYYGEDAHRWFDKFDIVPDMESSESKQQRALNLKTRMSLYKKKL